MTPEQQAAMDAALQKLESNKGAVVTLVGEFVKYVDRHKDDPVALDAFIARVNAAGDDLGALAAAVQDPDTTD